VSSTLPGADVRGFYRALGIELPGWAKREASVGCFADPGAHARGDRDPSCSVNVESGAWHCWGCGAAGGAYDAALACGRSAREAIELMVAHGLTTRRTGAQPHQRASSAARREGDAAGQRAGAAARVGLGADEQELVEARARLGALVWPPRVLRPEQARVWSRAALLELGCGFDRGRVIIPIRDAAGGLRGMLRYAPSHDHAPKVLAVRGTRLGLIPHPCAESSTWVVLVEGPPDMISARSRGLPAIAVPGDDAWEAEWARLLVGRHVSVVFDCDRAGREAAARVAADLKAAGVRGSIVDLARARADGYDLTEWLAERESLGVRELRRALGAPDARLRGEVPAAGR
jgi:Toprim-like